MGTISPQRRKVTRSYTAEGKQMLPGQICDVDAFMLTGLCSGDFLIPATSPKCFSIRVNTFFACDTIIDECMLNRPVRIHCTRCDYDTERRCPVWENVDHLFMFDCWLISGSIYRLANDPWTTWPIYFKRWVEKPSQLSLI